MVLPFWCVLYLFLIDRLEIPMKYPNHRGDISVRVFFSVLMITNNNRELPTGQDALDLVSNLPNSAQPYSTYLRHMPETGRDLIEEAEHQWISSIVDNCNLELETGYMIAIMRTWWTAAAGCKGYKQLMIVFLTCSKASTLAS